jgi:hypothetical protein
MPFLRRRGVLASESDMRRHTVIDQSQDAHSGPFSLRSKTPVPRKSLADELLRPEAANTFPRTSVESADDRRRENRPESRSGDGNGVGHSVGGGKRVSVDANMPSISMSISIDRPIEDPFDRPESPPVQEETPKHRRFSMLRFRNASDSQLSLRVRQQQLAEKPPPMPERRCLPGGPDLSSLSVLANPEPLPPAPAIITTAPTMDNVLTQKKSRIKLPIKLRRSGEVPRPLQADIKLKPAPVKTDRRKSMSGLTVNEEEPSAADSTGKHAVTFQAPRPRPQSSKSHPSPVSTGVDHGAALALPSNRLSESSRSEASSGGEPGGIINPGTASTTQTASSTSSTFFRLPRRKQKQPEPLFPLSHLPQKNKTSTLEPRASNSSLTNASATNVSRPSTAHSKSTAVASPPHGVSAKAPGSPAAALFRPGSRNSGQSSPTRANISLRGRSSTMSSIGRNSGEDHLFPGAPRTSSSIGRKSFGDLLGLSRLRPNTDPGRHGSLTPATPGSNASKNNSLQLTREKDSVTLPERREDETPARYLARLEDILSRGVIASALSKGTDPFSASVLRSYMRTFGFFEEPMDMAIRKLLMEAELPKETQQIDRCLQAFANRYHECNPGIYSSPDQAYFIAFSLLILHTDVFNKNNKYKMQKADYLKNTRGEGIFDDVLECFYDNITYTPFIHVEDDLEMNGDRIVGHKARKKPAFPNGTPEPPKRSKDPIDPYTLILDGKLDTLRPPLKDQIPLDEHYNYVGTARELNVRELQKTFFKTGVLQIVSARSRPDAFMTEKTLSNPQEAEPGIVDIKVTKVGTLWRKDAKKKKTRSPWQEWGAILTGAQLYFFRNTTWVKSLVHQYETHVKSGHDDIPLIFKPPLEQFKPDALMSTEGAVALFDQTYKKHKNAFVYVRHGGFEEVLLARDEDDRNDWLAKLNYAAAFRTSGVRMRGVVGSNYEGQGPRAIRRLDSSEVTQVIQTPTGEVSVARSRIDQQMALEILAARRFMMHDRIKDADEKLQAAQKQLDTQLRNARHLLILAPIQDKTRDQVRAGAARVIAQLKWSRTEIWRLKCHRDILLLDLDEDKRLNGDLGQYDEDLPSPTEKPSLNRKESRASSQKTLQQSPRSPEQLPLTRSYGSLRQATDGGSPVTEIFQTPPSSMPDLGAHKPGSRDGAPLRLDHPTIRKSSVSSATSSGQQGAMSPRPVSSPAPGPTPAPAPTHAPAPTPAPAPSQERSAYQDDHEEDAGERRVLEQAGLLEKEFTRTSDRPGSSAKGSDDTPDRQRRGAAPNSEKDKADRSKIRRSLQRTLREGTGHLSHHRSRKGKDSASSGALSDDMVRDDVLSRGTGSFTVHGKKASVVNFGSDLQGIPSDEHIRQRKQPQIEEHRLSMVSTDDDFHSVLGELSPTRERRESAASASTATAKSFRELHRKYSSAQNAYRNAPGGLVVPSDDDSDAALSFSDGRRTPLPPLEDESGDEDAMRGDGDVSSRRYQFFTPEAPGSPVDETAEDDDDKETAQQANERFSPPVQTVSA